MLFLELYTLPNATDGLDNILIETMTTVPSFIPFLLVFVFGVIWLGGMVRQNYRTGRADAPLWSVIASLSVFILALIMSMVEGIIHLDWLIIITIITIFSGIWLFLDKRQSEV